MSNLVLISITEDRFVVWTYGETQTMHITNRLFSCKITNKIHEYVDSLWAGAEIMSYMKSDGSLIHCQETAPESYPEADESSLHSKPHFFKSILILSFNLRWGFQSGISLQVFCLILYTHTSPL
jgi:hypothetical protein